MVECQDIEAKTKTVKANNRWGILCASLQFLLGCYEAQAGVPEPPHLLYGTISRIDGLVTSTENVAAVARIDAFAGQIVGEYQMGARPEIANLYYLPIALESLADGRPQSSDAALAGQTVSIYVRHGASQANEELVDQFVLTEVGKVERRDLSLDCCCNTPDDGNCCALFADVAAGPGLGRPGSNCQVDLSDIICELDGFAAGSNWTTACPAGDLVGVGPTVCGGNGRVDLFDIFASLNAFAGLATGCPAPCPMSQVCSEPALGVEDRPRLSDQFSQRHSSDKPLRLSLAPRRSIVKPGEPSILDVFVSGDVPIRGYQVSIRPRSDGNPNFGDIAVDQDDARFLFNGQSSVQAKDLNLRRAASARVSGSNAPSGRAYLGTFSFDVEENAEGTIAFEFDPKHCIFVGGDGVEIRTDMSEFATVRIPRSNPHTSNLGETQEAPNK